MNELNHEQGGSRDNAYKHYAATCANQELEYGSVQEDEKGVLVVSKNHQLLPGLAKKLKRKRP
jgi:hypothetical protein